MKPAWDKLMDDFKGSKSALVADVDCTTAGKPLCDSNGVKGFPTIMHGTPGNLQKYEGGRDYDALSAFAKENLGPSCGPDNMDLCSAEETAEIEKFMAMSDADLDKAIAEKDSLITDAEAKFKKGLDELQATHKAAEAKKTETVEAVKAMGLSMLKVVKGYTGSNFKCSILQMEGRCNDKEKKFITLMQGKAKPDWEKQVARLSKMAGGDMKPELKLWIWQRLRLLKQLLA